MSREVFEPTTLQEVVGFCVLGPCRLTFQHPRRGGPPLREVRSALRNKGRLRFSLTPGRLHADLDPLPAVPEPPLIAFDTIVRNDAAGLERAICSSVSHVDEIIVGIDARSDEETRAIAEAYADEVWTFEAKDIGLSEEDWKANKIHFANARNLGRERVKAEWTLVIDSDEYLAHGDLRAAVLNADLNGCDLISVNVALENFSDRNLQRLAKTKFRWDSPSHNRLVYGAARGAEADVLIVQDLSLRAQSEIDRRHDQRASGVEMLREAADGGNIHALFHLAKHRVGENNLADATKYSQDFRFRAEVHGPLAAERAYLALGVATLHYSADDLAQAEVWAQRALLDGPRIEPFCMLGDIAEDRGDLAAALLWYECACIVPDTERQKWTDIISRRQGRLAALRAAVKTEGAAPVAEPAPSPPISPAP